MIKTHHILLLLLLIGCRVGMMQAGNTRVDSLETALDKVISATEKVDLYYELAWELKNRDLAKADYYADKGIELAQELFYRDGLALAYKAKGVIAWFQSDIVSAREFFQRSLSIYENQDDKEGVANVLNNIGLTWQATGDYDKCISYLEKATKIREEIGDHMGMATSFNNLGVMYQMTGNYQEALERHTRALKIWEAFKENDRIASTYLNLGSIYQLTEDYDKALDTYREGLRIYRQNDHKRGMADTYSNLGDILLIKGKYYNALEEYRHSLELREELKDKTGMRESLGSIAQAYMKSGDLPEAQNHLKRALAISEEVNDKPGIVTGNTLLGEMFNKLQRPDAAISHLSASIMTADKMGALPELRNAYEQMTHAYVLKQDYKAAFGYQKQYQEIQDSLITEERQKAMLELEAKYENEKKQKEIDLLKKDQKIARLQLFSCVVAFLVILLAVISWMQYSRFRIKARAEAELAAQKAEIEARNKDLAISNTELEQFAYVVSHDLKQPLRTIGSYIGLINRRFGSRLEEDGREFMQYVMEGVSHMYGLLSDLLELSQTGKQGVPEVVDLNEVFSLTFRNLEQYIKERKANVQIDNMPMLVGNRTGMIQLFQNLINNAIKFNKNDAPVVEVKYHDELTDHLISIKDNGIGISETYQKKIFEVFQRLHTIDRYPGTGIGLAICRKVVHQHGGKIWVESTPGEGSTFFIRLPKAIYYQPNKLGRT